MSLTHGSLFAGIGGMDLGLEWAGFSSEWQVEIDPFCSAVLEKRFPNVQRFSDVKSVGKHNLKPVDLISGGFPCFAAETLILTYAGFKPIEDVKVGELVLTHLGQWKKVTSTMSRQAVECRKIEAQGMLPTTTTDEHPYYVRNKSRKWNKRSYSRVFSAPSWTACAELSKTSMLGQVLPPVEEDSHSTEFWWLVGRYLADGWRVVCNGKGRVVICASYKEAEQVKARITAAGFNCCADENRTTVKFHITRKSFYEFLELFGRYAHGKLVPGWVLSLPPDKTRALLNGYFTGDGSLKQNKKGTSKYWAVTTVSPSLALGIALLIQRGYNMVSSVYKTTVPEKTVIEGRTVSQRTQYSVRLPERNHKSFVEGNYGWKPVRTNERTNGTKVFNISVADDESYVANGTIVHNCQDVSVGAGGKERGLHRERSGLWFEYARIVLELQPNWVLIENVPNLKNFGADQVISDMEGAGYSCWASVVGADTFGAPFQRRRVFILCHNDSHGSGSFGEGMGGGWSLSPECERKVAQACQDWKYWVHELGAGNARSVSGAEESESDSYARNLRAVHGVSDGMDRLKALGNACTPVIPAIIGEFIQNFEKEK